MDRQQSAIFARACHWSTMMEMICHHALYFRDLQFRAAAMLQLMLRPSEPQRCVRLADTVKPTFTIVAMA